MPEEEQFFQKLGEIPVVIDGWTAAWEYYSRVKDYNALTRLSLGMAESSVKVAGKISTPVLSPVISKYQPQIDTVNDFACKKLDEMENKYPLIKQPTEELKEACSEYFVQPIVGKVKPVVTQVQGMLDNSKKQVARIKSRGTNAVVGAKDFGVNTVSNVVHATLDTPPGRFTTGTIDGVLDRVDVIIEKYLPEEKEDKDTDEKDDEDDSDDESGEPKGNVEPMEKDAPTPERVAVHLKCVSEKIRRRMYRLAVRDFRKARAETVDALNKMTNTFQLVGYARQNFTSARGKVEEMWTKIVKESEETGDKENASLFAGTLEERIIALGTMMTSQVKSGISLLEKTSTELGSLARNPVTKTKEYSDVVKSFSFVQSIQDFSSERLEQLLTSVNTIQKKCRSLLEGMQAPEWLQMDLDMDIQMDDNDITIDQVVSSNNNSEDELEREDLHADDRESNMEEDQD